MAEGFDNDAINLMAGALHNALERLRTLGLVDGDASAASTVLARLIGEAVGQGERDGENLVLYAIGRFQRPAGGASK